MTPLASRTLPLAALILGPIQAAWAAYDLPALEKVERQVQAVAEKAMPCVVSLTHQMKGGMAAGSGVIIGRNGLLLTAAHVVSDKEIVDVTFPDGKTVPAKVLGADYDRDVALAVITEPGEYPFVELGDTKDLAVGELVVALGHSGGFDLRRKPPVRFGRVFEFNHGKYIRSDCTLVGGDSGGPLFDLNGKVIGVHSSVGAEMSVNNDAPAEIVRKDWDRLVRGERWGRNPVAEVSKLTEKELGGLDLEQFRQRVLSESMKSKGKLAATPETISGWLKESGMSEDRVKAMDPFSMIEFMQKALGGLAEAKGFPNLSDDSSGPKMSAEELAGLDLNQFRKRILTSGLKNGGRLETKPSDVAQWLRECGMKEERVESLNDGELISFITKALGGIGAVKAQVAPKDSREGKESEKAKPDDQDLAGLDTKKFQQRIIEEALKSKGAVTTTPENLAKWLEECGMSAERLKNATPEELSGFLKKAMGSGAEVRTGAEAPTEVRAISEQDKEVLAAVKPGLEKVASSVVVLRDDDRTLAMGTIVRANGFILTKHSEIAKAKGALRARLADGRELPAVEVQQFADHDLALVKVAADSLPAVRIPELHDALVPGRLIFTPRSGSEDAMLAMGVVSVTDRSLKESGGYLGIGLSEGKEFVEVGEVMPGGPAARAGLQRKDQILSIDDQPFHKALELSQHIRSLKPEAKVQLKYRRGDEEKSAEITLGDRSQLASKDEKPNPVTSIGTEVSDQRGGYPLIFQHDQPLKPEDCGSVVVDLHGEVVGINIARVGRVDTYAIPVGIVAELLKSVDFEALEKKAAEAAVTPPKPA